jgi:hypothetical protein
VFERLDLIRDTIERNIEQSLQIMLEDTRGKQLITRFEQELAHARVERSKHAEGSYLYNLIAATFQEKRNALEVLGVKVYIHPPAETPSRAPVVTEQEWLSIPEASALTGISQPSLFYHIRHETLTAHSRNVPMTVIHRDELARYLKLKRPHVSLEPYDEWFSINKIREAKIANYRPLHRAIRRGEITTHTRDVPHPYIHRDELNRFLTESPVRPKDTLEDIQPRIEITYTPMFTGVQSSFG